MNLPPAPGDVIPIHAYPKAPANRVEGWTVDASGQQWLKVRIACAPEDGKANTALIRLLAREWGVPASSLKIVLGETSRYKRILYQP